MRMPKTIPLDSLALQTPASAETNVRTRHGPGGGFIQRLAIDPQNPATTYAGTQSAGIFKSTDGGASWSAASGGLAVLSVTALTVDGQDSDAVYSATSGGVGTITWTPSDATGSQSSL